MAEKKKSFSDLLNDAPLAAQEDTITLVGALARSNQSGKFVLTLGSGNTVTLDVAAVKGYQVMGGAVGQPLVQVEVDREKVPETVQGQLGPIKTFAGFDQPITHPTIDQPVSHPLVDYPITHPVVDHPIYKDPYFDVTGKGLFESTGTIAETGGYPGSPGDPYAGAGYAGGGAAVPFTLATPHHAPSGAFAGALATNPYADHPVATHPMYDVKHPLDDGGATFIPGYRKPLD